MIENFESVWEEFSIPLKSFIRRRINNDQDVEDILQMVFLKIYSNINNLKASNKIHSWIYKITRNTITDYYRRNDKNLEMIELPEDLESGTDEELSANTEIASCLRVMIDSLPEIYKQAIILTEFQNMTQKELGEKLGISISGAKSRVQRGREKLKKVLLGCCYLDFDSSGNIIDYKHKSSKCKFC